MGNWRNTGSDALQNERNKKKVAERTLWASGQVDMNWRIPYHTVNSTLCWSYLRHNTKKYCIKYISVHSQSLFSCFNVLLNPLAFIPTRFVHGPPIPPPPPPLSLSRSRARAHVHTPHRHACVSLNFDNLICSPCIWYSAVEVCRVAPFFPFFFLSGDLLFLSVYLHQFCLAHIDTMLCHCSIVRQSVCCNLHVLLPLGHAAQVVSESQCFQELSEGPPHPCLVLFLVSRKIQTSTTSKIVGKSNSPAKHQRLFQ